MELDELIGKVKVIVGGIGGKYEPVVTAVH